MASLTSRLLVSAERFYVAVSAEERRVLDRIFGELCEDPDANGQSKSRMVVQPAVMTLYITSGFRILYYIQHDDLFIFQIDRAE